MRQDFLTHDFGEQKFDLVLLNPPFNGKKKNDNSLWKRFVEKSMVLSSGFVGCITPRGAVKQWYSKNHSKISKVLLLSEDDMNIGAKSAILIISSKDSGTTEVINQFTIENSRYPKEIPQLKGGMTLGEYDQIFDQLDGVKFSYRRLDAESKHLSGLTRNSDWYGFATEDDLRNQGLSGFYIAPMNEDDATRLGNQLMKLCKEGKLTAWEGHGMKLEIRDFNYIRV